MYSQQYNTCHRTINTIEMRSGYTTSATSTRSSAYLSLVRHFRLYAMDFIIFKFVEKCFLLTIILSIWYFVSLSRILLNFPFSVNRNRFFAIQETKVNICTAATWLLLF